MLLCVLQLGYFNFPPCGIFANIYYGNRNERCFRIDAVPMAGYWFNAAAVGLQVLSGFDGSPTAKFLHRRLFPHDADPPPTCLRCKED